MRGNLAGRTLRYHIKDHGAVPETPLRGVSQSIIKNNKRKYYGTGQPLILV